MAVKREVMTWGDLGASTRELALAVAADGYDPDRILSIARGGLLVGAALGHALSVKHVDTTNVEHYTGEDHLPLEVPRILPPAPDFVALQDARILIADIADAGYTLESVRGFCAGKVGEARIAVLYERSYGTRTSPSWCGRMSPATPEVTRSGEARAGGMRRADPPCL